MANFGLIGHPLSHSFSQEYFVNKFKNQGLNHRYLNIDLGEIKQLKQHVELAKLKGFNVTIPYKTAIINHLDSLDKSAAEIGAVNCVKIADGFWIGFNTDFIGFTRSLMPFLNESHKSALILGTGGASKAIAYAFKMLGIQYHFASRNRENGFLYSDLKSKMNDFQVIVNTTPLGTFPKTEECPEIPYDELTESHICFDLVYNPSNTLFLRKAKQLGAAVKNGQEMLEIQADESWKIWN